MDNLRPSLGAARRAVAPAEAFADLRADAHVWIERREGLLENHEQKVPPILPHVSEVLTKVGAVFPEVPSGGRLLWPVEHRAAVKRDPAREQAAQRVDEAHEAEGEG